MRLRAAVAKEAATLRVGEIVAGVADERAGGADAYMQCNYFKKCTSYY